MMKIVFLGTGAIGVPSLQALAGDPAVTVAAVVTQPDRPAGRHLHLRPSPVAQTAGSLGIPVLKPEKIRDPEAVDFLRGLGAGVFVVAAYGQILPPSVLGIPRLGCINIHASLLPRHRGASPIQAAILGGDTHSGITIMWVDEGLDTGDILLARATPIGAGETAGELHDRLALLAPDALRDALRAIAGGHPPRTPQDSAQATLCPKISKHDAAIDWGLPAADIVRRIRAFHPWPGAWCRLPDGRLLKVHRARVADRECGAGVPGTVLAAGEGGIDVVAGGGAVCLLEVQPAGGKRMGAAAFLAGHPLSQGARFAESSPTPLTQPPPKFTK
jgi:methionyl-tRNA formyltransferase